MPVIDPTTNLGRVRLRIGDWADIPMLPDSVITATLDDCQQNVPRAASQCAQYVLATLTSKTHKKLSQIETWSGEQFNNYVRFLQMTILNPHLSQVAPIPYVGGSGGLEVSELVQFMQDWKDGYQPGSYVMPPTGPGRIIDDIPT